MVTDCHTLKSKESSPNNNPQGIKTVHHPLNNVATWCINDQKCVFISILQEL